MSFLSLVPETPPSPGRTAIELMNEAKAAGDQQVTALLRTVEQVITQAHEIVEGGDIYPAGVRDAAFKLAEQAAYKAQAIVAIMRPQSQTDDFRSSGDRRRLAAAQANVVRSIAETYELDFPEED